MICDYYFHLYIYFGIAQAADTPAKTHGIFMCVLWHFFLFPYLKPGLSRKTLEHSYAELYFLSWTPADRLELTALRGLMFKSKQYTAHGHGDPSK